METPFTAPASRLPRSPQPQVSVIIPTYNRRAHVVQAVASALNQSHNDFEVIVVNDGSTDDTAQSLCSLKEQGVITYIEQPNRGLAHARNAGILAARGTFIAFLDDDDLWPKDKLLWQANYLLEHPDVGVVGGTHIPFTDEVLSLEGESGTEATFTFEDMFAGSPFTSPGQTMVRRSALREVGGFDPDIWAVDDLDMYMRLARSTRVKRVPKLSLFYRLHANNMSKRILPMLKNAKKVLAKNLPFVPPHARRASYIAGRFWLYEYLGKKVVASIRSEFHRGRLWSATKTFFLLYPLLWSIVTIPSLGRMFLRDLTNVRFRRA